MLELLTRPGYGSELVIDGHCPHCGAHEQYHAQVEQPADAVEQVCPFCDARTAVWLDKHNTATYRACKHFRQVVALDGRLQLEFTQR